jgi:cell division transport system permease protein
MQLVGARPTFIQMPFLRRAGIQGFISGIFASGILFLLIQYCAASYPDLVTGLNFGFQLLLYFVLCLAGILLGISSAFIAIRGFLKLSLDQLYQ